MTLDDEDEEKKMAKLLVKEVDTVSKFFVLSTDVQISDTVYRSFAWPLRESSEKPLDEVGQTGRQIVEAIIALYGVTSVNIDRYEVVVHIGQAIEFAAVGPKAVAAFQAVVKVDEIHGPKWAKILTPAELGWK